MISAKTSTTAEFYREDIAGEEDQLFISNDWVIDYLARRLKAGLAHPDETAALSQADLNFLTDGLYEGYAWHYESDLFAHRSGSAGAHSTKSMVFARAILGYCPSQFQGFVLRELANQPELWDGLLEVVVVAAEDERF